MKYFVFSIDDGTIFDKMTIPLFNKYRVRCTFNLNSGLDNFTWYLGDIPITRLVLKENIHLYDGHEVASHTLTHTYLDSCNDEEVIRQVKEDKNNIESIFQRKIDSFATPFETCGEREISLIRNTGLFTNIRMSEIDESFQIPEDPYHFKVTSLDVNRALALVDNFIRDKNARLFIYAGHSYDFYVNNTFDKLEQLLQKITHEKEIKILTMGELTKEIFN